MYRERVDWWDEFFAKKMITDFFSILLVGVSHVDSDDVHRQFTGNKIRPHPHLFSWQRRVTTRTRAPLPVMKRGWGEVCMKGRGWGLKNFSSSSLIRRRTSSINLMRTIGQNILIFCLSVGDMKASMRGSGYGCKKTFLTM